MITLADFGVGCLLKKKKKKQKKDATVRPFSGSKSRAGWTLATWEVSLGIETPE